jgi:hypothetical protein
MEQVHAPVKSKSSGKAADAAADNDDAMGFLLHVSFLVYSPSPSMAIYMHLGRRPPRQNNRAINDCMFMSRILYGRQSGDQMRNL